MLHAGWVMIRGSPCHPTLEQRLSRLAKVSLGLLTLPIERGILSDRVEVEQLEKYKRNMYPSALVCGHLDSVGDRSAAKLKPG